MRQTLRILAAVVWYGGATVLLLKGMEQLAAAEVLRPDMAATWLIAAAGVLLGGWQAATVFRRNCEKNLDRIARLPNPRLWQFFRPGFFLALALMITTGALLSRMAEGLYWPLVWVGSLDLMLATSLAGSSIVFWQQGAVARKALPAE